MTQLQVLQEVSKRLNIPLDQVKTVINLYTDQKVEFLNNMEVEEISMLYLGTYVIDMRMLMSMLVRYFYKLKNIKWNIKLLEVYPDKDEVHEFALKQYHKATEIYNQEFKELWEIKNRYSYRFMYTRKWEALKKHMENKYKLQREINYDELLETSKREFGESSTRYQRFSQRYLKKSKPSTRRRKEGDRGEIDDLLCL